ncbi:carbohydrate kinase family protein [Candidatus Nomurabacteria bacterium]|nr:carbohydrate kinase family protein [Candidatus Nomurabacteria bacterium]
MEKIDFLAIGDTVIDAFIKLTDADRADIRGEAGHEDYKICLPFADKIPYEEVYILNAVGNAANAAVSASRLGLKTALVSNLGDDQNGKDCLASLEKDGVSTKFIKINEGIKTNYHYVLWYKTERTILIKHEKYPYILPDIGEPAWVYFSSVSKTAFPFHNTFAEYLENHPNIKFAFQPGKNEINLGKEKLARLYARTEIFFCNLEEARTILEMQEADVLQLSEALTKLGPKIVSISDGPNGAYLYFNNELWQLPIYPDIAPPLERTGAGDAFSSTFTAGLVLGKSPLEAFTWGPINSMSVVQEIGAQKGLLSREKLEEYLKNAPAEYKVKKIN